MLIMIRIDHLFLDHRTADHNQDSNNYVYRLSIEMNTLRPSHLKICGNKLFENGMRIIRH